jgi:hypothetical protein
MKDLYTLIGDHQNAMKSYDSIDAYKKEYGYRIPEVIVVYGVCDI